MKEHKDTLKGKKKLVIQKDEEVQAALLKKDEEREKVIAKFLESNRFFDLQFVQYFKVFKLLHRWMMKHHNQVSDFANLDFEAIDTEILADEANENEGETVAKAIDVVDGDGAVTGGTTAGGVTNKACMDVDHVEEVVNAP